MQKLMQPADLLLGRKTFEIFASYWPAHAANWPGINEVTKYVVSSTPGKSDWQNSVFLTSVDDIKKLKDSDGSDLHVIGSSVLVQTLLKHDLVDELVLMMFPITLGSGKRRSASRFRQRSKLAVPVDNCTLHVARPVFPPSGTTGCVLYLISDLRSNPCRFGGATPVRLSGATISMSPARSGARYGAASGSAGFSNTFSRR